MYVLPYDFAITIFFFFKDWVSVSRWMLRDILKRWKEGDLQCKRENADKHLRIANVPNVTS